MTLQEWLHTLTEELELAGVEMDQEAMHTVLDLARDAAHQIARPAAPLTTFMVGVAVGQGRSLPSAAAAATTLAMTHGSTEDHSADEHPQQ